MDRQEAELRAQLQGTGVSVTRIGYEIVLNMPSSTAPSPTDQDAVKAGLHPTLNSVALVLKRFNQTTVDVFGFTDFDRRAVAISTYCSGGRCPSPTTCPGRG